MPDRIREGAAFRLDVLFVLRNGKEVDGDNLIVRTYLKAETTAEMDKDHTREVLNEGILNGTSYDTIPLPVNEAVYMCYPTYDMACNDAAALVAYIANRLAADDASDETATFFTITDDWRDSFMVRAAAIDAVRVRLWEVTRHGGPRLISAI